jgi:hypothetical protein
MNSELIIKTTTLVVSFVIALKGLFEYSKSQKVKKFEILNKLIDEFEHTKTEVARLILDEFSVEGDNGKVYKRDLQETLRNHKDKLIPFGIETEVRESFDKLLDFYSKLEYMLMLGLLNKNDLFYFQYCLQKIFDDKAILKYCEIYGYTAIFRLKRIFNQKSKFRTVITLLRFWYLRNI